MPKLKGPLFSITASGKLGDGITYHKSNMGQGVRARKYKKTGRSSGQVSMRNWFKKGFSIWRNDVVGFGYYISAYCTGLILDQRNLWIRSAVIERMTGINLFIQNWMRRSPGSLPQYQLPGKIGFCLSGEWTAGELIAGGKFIMGG